MPGPEDGMLLVTVQIGKWSRRRSGDFFVRAAGCDFLVEPTLGVTVVVGAELQVDGVCTAADRSSRQVPFLQLFSQHSAQNVLLNGRVLPVLSCFGALPALSKVEL